MQQRDRQRDGSAGPADYAASVLDAFGAADYELDLVTGALRPSPRLNALYGYSPGYPLTADDCCARCYPDDRPMLDTLVADTVRSGERRFQRELRLMLPGGATRWVLSRGEIVLGADGRPAVIRGAAIDITERRQAEAARHESEERLRLLVEDANAELEARVEERTAALAASDRARQLLLRELVLAQEEERLRVARDLHDQMGQQIAGLLLGLKQLEQRAEGGPLAPLLPPLQAIAHDLAKESHRMAMNLWPTALDDVGLAPALERLVLDLGAQVAIQVAFHGSGFDRGRLPLVLEITIYRAVQEALSNVREHAAARRVSLLLERHADQVVAIVEDDGRGFDPDKPLSDEGRPQLGLREMRERVAHVGGSLEVESAPGSGTTVFIRIPLSNYEL